MANEFEVYDKQKAAYEKQFDYAENAKEFLDKVGAKITIRFKECGKHFEDDAQDRNRYYVTITRNGKRFKYIFGDSLYNTFHGIKPTEYDVTACLEKYDVGSFGEFCNEFGYEQFDDYGRENAKVKRIYKAVCREAEKVNELFGDVIDEFAEVCS